MSTGIYLGEYSTTPLYNIKAVVQATEISPSTLRAWERRYNVCNPQRSDSGYRLYSERDVAVLQWLKMQVDTGMAIGQAAAWYESLLHETRHPEQVVLPGSSTDEMLAHWGTNGDSGKQHAKQARSLELLQQELMNALLSYNEEGAGQLLAEAFAMYTLEQIGEQLIAPVLVEVGKLWHSGQISITTEHYVSNYLKHRLSALIQTSPNGPGAQVWVGCAPNEQHEIAPMLLALYLRRAGYRVRYLGQRLPVDDLVSDVQKSAPDIVILSASTKEAASELQRTTEALANLQKDRLIIGYGGRIFNEEPQLRSSVPGIFLGAKATDAVDMAKELLRREQQASD